MVRGEDGAVNVPVLLLLLSVLFVMEVRKVAAPNDLDLENISLLLVSWLVSWLVGWSS